MWVLSREAYYLPLWQHCSSWFDPSFFFFETNLQSYSGNTELEPFPTYSTYVPALCHPTLSLASNPSVLWIHCSFLSEYLRELSTFPDAFDEQKGGQLWGWVEAPEPVPSTSWSSQPACTQQPPPVALVTLPSPACVSLESPLSCHLFLYFSPYAPPPLLLSSLNTL